MSMVQTWTLWQRMPPRYQLTTKSLPDDPDELVAIGNAPDRAATPRKVSSPRPYSAGNQSPPLSSRRASQRENFMLSSNVPPPVQNEIKESLASNQPKGASFPKRSSDYINTFQKQCRVNSARRRLAEVPPTPNRSTTQQQSLTLTEVPPTHRAKTAPIFPVTNPEAHKARKSRLSDHSSMTDSVIGKNVSNAKAKPRVESSKVDVFQFEDTKSSVSSSVCSTHTKARDPEPKAKKYVVQDTNKATVYIDNGKVMYFGKSRHDLTQLLKTQSLRADRSNCFLAEIRRDYLKHPKYERSGKGNAVSKCDHDPRRIENERVDYNRRVEHILSYYDENQPESRLSFMRPSSGLKKGSRVKGLSFIPPTGVSSRPSSGSPTPDPMEALPNDFIRFNKQAKIHKRQFYLRTPGIQHGGNVADLEKCRCSMCRMELQLGLVTGNTQDINLAMVAAANESAIHGNAVGTHSKSKIVINEAAVPRKNGVRANTQKVTFQKPQEEEKSESNKVRINCKLPEVTDMAVSESGFESSRTQDATSTIADDLTEIEK